MQFEIKVVAQRAFAHNVAMSLHSRRNSKFDKKKVGRYFNALSEFIVQRMEEHANAPATEVLWKQSGHKWVVTWVVHVEADFNGAVRFLDDAIAFADEVLADEDELDVQLALLKDAGPPPEVNIPRKRDPDVEGMIDQKRLRTIQARKEMEAKGRRLPPQSQPPRPVDHGASFLGLLKRENQ